MNDQSVCCVVNTINAVSRSELVLYGALMHVFCVVTAGGLQIKERVSIVAVAIAVVIAIIRLLHYLVTALWVRGVTNSCLYS